jgi:hypothetical protein
MKYLLPILLLLPSPVVAQQVNQFAVCTQNQEVYSPGGYDAYGNYIPGGVSVQTYNVPCNNVNQGYRSCNPTRTVLGAVLGGAVGRAAASNYPRNYGWATALGASVGGLAFAC